MPPDTGDNRPLEADGWHTLRRFLPYLWPRENPSLRARIAAAMVFVLLAKGVTLALPFAYKHAVDAMSGPANEAAMVAIALVLAYGFGRFTSVAFDNLRNIAFERVGQIATLNLAQDVFRRLHRLSLRFHLARRTGEVTKIIERGTKSIDTMLYFLLFNIAPTAIELVAVGVIFYINFGWELVAATGIAVGCLHSDYALDHRVANQAAPRDERTRWASASPRGRLDAQLRDGQIFRCRTARGRALRRRCPRLCRGCDQERELAGYSEYRAGADHQPANGRRHGIHRLGLEPRACSRPAILSS